MPGAKNGAFTVHGTPAISLEQALSLHRKGNLPGAEMAYRTLLAVSPNDPFLLGQLGALALKQGRVSEAEALLRRALAAGGNPRVRLCNLQSYLGLIMRRKDREKEARRLIATGIPDWPQGVKPNPAERNLLLLLAQSLIALDQPAKGVRLLDQAFPDRAEDVQVLSMEGRLRLAVGDAEGAVRLLERAVKRAPNRPAPLIALSAAQARMGRRAEAQEATKLIARRFPYLRKPRRHRQTPTILVLNPPPREIGDPGATIQKLHFRFNYPSEFQVRMEHKYRFLSVFGSIAPGVRPWEADEPSVVLNNLVDEMEMSLPGSVERVRALIDRIGAPVINPPEAVVQVSREKNAETLAGIPGLKVPRMARYRVAEGGIDATVADIGRTFGYPVILRHPWVHATASSLRGEGPKTVYLVSNAREAREALAESGWPDLYAIEFVDLRKKEGWYRKLRAICMGDEIVVLRGGCYSEWLIAGGFRKPEGIAFYRARPESVEHLRAILNDPQGELGPGCLEALRQIRDRIPLDIFGIDFDVDDAGQVVLFEATPGMVIQHPRAGTPPDLWLPMKPFDRIHAAFHRLVARCITARASLPGDRVEEVIEGSLSDEHRSAN